MILALTIQATLAELFTEVLCDDTATSVVATLARVVTRYIVVNAVGGVVTFHLNFTEVGGPEAARRRHTHTCTRQR